MQHFQFKPDEQIACFSFKNVNLSLSVLSSLLSWAGDNKAHNVHTLFLCQVNECLFYLNVVAFTIYII